MAAAKGSRALYGTKAAQEKAAKVERRRNAQVPFYDVSSSAFDDGVSRRWTEDNPAYKPTRGGSKLPGTRARMKAAEKRLKETGDDYVSRADILNALDGATNNMKKGGKVQTSADTARKLATEMGGMKKGGKPKANGLAVMIAIGSPKKPVKKMGGGMMYADGGKPDKFAQGGAGKVRKGMMTPEGKIIHAINKVRGK